MQIFLGSGVLEFLGQPSHLCNEYFHRNGICSSSLLGTTTLSSTVVELIYILTSSA